MCIVTYKNFASTKDNQQKEIHPHVFSSSTEDDDAEEVLFPVHFRGVFSISAPKRLFGSAYLSSQTFLGGTVARKQITLTFLDPATISLIFWDDDVVSSKKSFQTKIRKETQHLSFVGIYSPPPKFSPSFPKFQRFHVSPSFKGIPLEAWASTPPASIGGFGWRSRGLFGSHRS